MRTMLTVIAGLLIVLSAGAEPQSSVTQIMPKPSQLGAGWTSDHVMMLVDPLCLPSEQVRLPAAVEMMSRSHREAYALVQYYYETNRCFVVVINRFSHKEDIGEDWGKDKDTHDSPGTLPKVGEEVHFSQRDGVHDDITFRRGRYLINVESIRGHGLDQLKRLAEVLDRNLLQAQATSAPNSQGPGSRK